MRNLIGPGRPFAAALVFGAAAFAQDSTQIYVEISYDEVQWAPQLAFVPGQTINVRVRVAFQGTSTVLGFAGMTYQPTISPWPAGSTVLPFTSSDGTGVPDVPGNRGRILPYAFSGMNSGSAPGLLTWHMDPGSVLRFAGANAVAMTTNLAWGVSSGLIPQWTPPPLPNVGVLFKTAVVIDSSQPSLEYVFDVPIAGILGRRAAWYRTPSGTGSLLTSITAADIHPARAYIGGNPCIFPPYFTAQPQPFSCDSGQAAGFDAAAEFGLCGPQTSRWHHGSTPLVDNSRISGSSTLSLIVRGVGLADAGEYRLLATNGFGSTWSNTASLQVRCTADFDDGSGTGTRDGGVTIDDLLYYLVLYAGGLFDADIDDGSGTGMRDGGVTIDDLLYYLVRFELGC